MFALSDPHGDASLLEFFFAKGAGKEAATVLDRFEFDDHYALKRRGHEAHDSIHANLWNGRHETATPGAGIGELCDDFITQIPRQNKDVAGADLLDRLRRPNGNVATRKQFTLLCGVAIGDKAISPVPTPE